MGSGAADPLPIRRSCRVTWIGSTLWPSVRWAWLATAARQHRPDMDMRAADPASIRSCCAATRVGSAPAFSPEGRWLATAGDDKTARLWDLQALDPAADPIVLRGRGSDQLFGLSPRHRGALWLATGSADRTARLWLSAPRSFCGSAGHARARRQDQRPDLSLTALAATARRFGQGQYR